MTQIMSNKDMKLLWMLKKGVRAETLFDIIW
jgi:hypothetical protein